MLAAFALTRLPNGASGHKFGFAGETRSYILYQPKTLAPHPMLVVALHGARGNGAGFERRTKGSLDRLADRDGALVVYPTALSNHWNTGHAYDGNVSRDDVGYLSALIASLTREFNVDPKRVYVTGFSSGASMAYRLACERPNQIAAIAPVAGGLAQDLMPACAVGVARPVPLLLIHGTADPVNRFNDGEREGNLWFWADRNGCARPPAISQLPDAATDNTRTRVETYAPCRGGGTAVVFYAVEGGGHAWPGDEQPRPSNGPAIRDFDASDVIWDFFRRHPMP